MVFITIVVLSWIYYWAFMICSVLLPICLVRFIIQRRVAWAYMLGMSQYALLNWKGENEAHDIALAIRDEWVEVLEAWHAGNLKEVILECLDVWHGMVKLIFTLCFPNHMKSNYVYFVMYSLCWVTSDKHGYRYLRSGCIRSDRHHKECYGIDHKCYFRNPGESNYYQKVTVEPLINN